MFNFIKGIATFKILIKYDNTFWTIFFDKLQLPLSCDIKWCHCVWRDELGAMLYNLKYNTFLIFFVDYVLQYYNILYQTLNKGINYCNN